MEGRRRLGYLATRKHGKMFSSYDNDTFVADPEIEWKRESLSRINGVGVILNNDDKLLGIEKKMQTNSNGSNLIDVGDVPFLNRGNRISNNTGHCTDKEEKAETNAQTDENEVFEDVNRNTVSSPHKDNLVETTSDKNRSQSDLNHSQSDLKPPISRQVRKRSPLLSGKSLSFDCSNQFEKNNSTTTSTTSNGTRDKIPKQRSFSDTRNPITLNRLNDKTYQFEDENGEKQRRKYKYQNDFNSLSPIKSREQACPSETDTKTLTEVPQNNDKHKGKKRWQRKLARYATFDEGNVYVASKSTQDLLWNNEQKISSPDKTDKTKTENESCDQCTKEATPLRKVSAGKLLRQSMSNGISKFKQLSMTSRIGSRKVDYEYCMIDNEAMFHETSKRIEPLNKSTEVLPAILNMKSNENESTVPRGSFRRSFSVPDHLDSTSTGDEELSDLYLPRRMAICPDLPVPAMNQLRTYLVLTRLKQYCIV